MKTLVLDPGHGGTDPGAVGPTGLTEASVVLEICKSIKELLHGKVRVCLTRDDNSTMSLSERSRISNQIDPDFFLSVHMNAANGRATGVEVFTTLGETKADPFATTLINVYMPHFPGWKKRTDLSDGDPDKESKFSVLRRTRAPAALFECQFIDEPVMEEWFKSQHNRDVVAGALAEGILTHLALMPVITAPRPPDDQLLRDALAAVDTAARLLRERLLK